MRVKKANRGLALVVGPTGAIGSAIVCGLKASGQYKEVVELGRSSHYRVDLLSEDTIRESAQTVSKTGYSVDLLIIASGILHSEKIQPEKSWIRVEPDTLEKLFQINAIGPMLVMKHFAPLLSKNKKTVIACLSARVGSIEENELGGWYGYRASKAALNQFIKTTSIELKRRKPGAICVALHPGTVSSKLSEPFSKAGLNVKSPENCAELLIKVIDQLTPQDTGGFFDYQKREIAW
jgi:NAD(P)-dependent dehydrogenase (short-subunit alcohol dehydrogenase family)